MSTELKKLKIYRGNWGWRDSDISSSALRNPDTGRKCCLGFVASACGVSAKKMNNIGMPEGLDDKDIQKFPQFLWREDRYGDLVDLVNSDIAQMLADINDDPKMTRQEKEVKITEIFAENGIEVEFTG